MIGGVSLGKSYKSFAVLLIAALITGALIILDLGFAHAASENEEGIPDGWAEQAGEVMYYIDGEPAAGVVKIDGYRYYFNKKGYMRTGFITYQGNRYYFDDDTGKALSAWQEIDGNRYYFGKKNIMITGLKKIKGTLYYFKDTGVQYKGFKNVNGKRYYFTRSGAAKGFRKIKGKKYYFKSNGNMAKGRQNIDGDIYYFRKNGVMVTGWLKLKGYKYYFRKSGKRISGGTYKINGKKRTFNSKGIYVKLKGYQKKVWNKGSSTNYLVMIHKGSRMITVFKGGKHNWKKVRRHSCSIGAPGTPTPSGTFKIRSKVYHFGENKGYTCWYASGFIGTTYLMHSVVCYRGTMVPSDGRLGMAISHGCVRMALGNAKWIYNNVPTGSTVYIY